MNIEPLSLDQLRVFLAVVAEGSFTGAARRVRRAQSAVSYAIAMLEQQLGLALFDRSGPRPILTEAGRALLVDAEALAGRADALTARARALAAGLEAEVGLVVDVMFPVEELAAILADFQAAFPTVTARLYVETLGRVTQLVLEDTCAVGIQGTFPETPPALESHVLRPLVMVPVAAPGHPLAAHRGTVPYEALRDAVQIVLTDRSSLTEGKDFNVVSARNWRVADLGAKHALIRAGLGWGTLPAHLTDPEIAAGRLARLRVAHLAVEGDRLPLRAIRRRDRPPGPAARWLWDRLTALRGDAEGA
ncbi:MAG TPA: LysR family transcriptional regulator [Azospirillaceae bacterium]|nr:LysR family transcriptional regulator [Azospirillaceae bacterium]